MCVYIYIYSFTYIEITQLSKIFQIKFIPRTRGKKRKKRARNTVDKKENNLLNHVDKNFEKQDSNPSFKKKKAYIFTRIIYIVSKRERNKIKSNQKSHCRKNSIHSIFYKNNKKESLEKKKEKRTKRKKRKKKSEG